MKQPAVKKTQLEAKGVAFYDRDYSIGLGKRLKLWFASLRFGLGSIGGSGKAKAVPKKPPAPVEKNNDKKKTAQIVILPPTTNIRGDLVTEGDVKFHGRIQGNIVARGAFVVGRGGVIRGNVQADVCAIGGKVIGNVRCTGSVEIMDSGYLRGDIETAESVMVKGRIRGNIHSDTRASILNSANVAGDLNSPRIRIDSSAEFKGRINCGDSVILSDD